MKFLKLATVFCATSFATSTWYSTPTDAKIAPDFADSTVTAVITINRTSPPCLQMYYCIEKYAKEYDIPLDYAYGVAYAETRYEGPFDWDYKHSQTSPAGAVGPMQIMPRYADPYIDEKHWTAKDLKTNIEMNVKASMRILRKLKDKHGDWKLAFGAYNTGRPCINKYAEIVYNYKPEFKPTK